MIILAILSWLGIMLAVTGVVLTIKDNECLYLLFILMGGIMILLSWAIALYDFGQLPPSFDWFRQLLKEND
jgi:hypothetical protein